MEDVSHFRCGTPHLSPSLKYLLALFAHKAITNQSRPPSYVHWEAVLDETELPIAYKKPPSPSSLISRVCDGSLYSVCVDYYCYTIFEGSFITKLKNWLTQVEIKKNPLSSKIFVSHQFRVHFGVQFPIPVPPSNTAENARWNSSRLSTTWLMNQFEYCRATTRGVCLYCGVIALIRLRSRESMEMFFPQASYFIATRKDDSIRGSSYITREVDPSILGRGSIVPLGPRFMTYQREIWSVDKRSFGTKVGGVIPQLEHQWAYCYGWRPNERRDQRLLWGKNTLLSTYLKLSLVQMTPRIKIGGEILILGCWFPPTSVSQIHLKGQTNVLPECENANFVCGGWRISPKKVVLKVSLVRVSVFALQVLW